MGTKWLQFALTTLVLSGCLGTVEQDPPIVDGPAPVTPSPEWWNGTVWYPPAAPTTGAVVEVPFVLSAAGATVDVVLRKRSVPFPQGTTDLSSAMAELLDPDGTVRGEAYLTWNGTQEGTITVVEAGAGGHTLRLTLYGASLNGMVGHRLDYGIVAHFPTGKSGGSA